MKTQLIALVLLFSMSSVYAQDDATKKNQKMMKKSARFQDAARADDGHAAIKAAEKMTKKQDKKNKKAARYK
jgi:hypothetical protein